MWYGLIDGKIVIETFAKSQKVLNLRRDPKITVMLESGTTYDQLKGLSIQGRAELVEDEARVHEVMRAVLGRNHPDMDEKTLDTAVEMGAKKRLAVVVHPEKVVSWDHTKLGGSY
jgi:nitroimidazol reductase NimA-like FMN-containing flavoprotein (pyridoxamine 5'-phosphate oxidase superfamily)